MNYDKQKAISDEDLKLMQENAKGYVITQTKNYPKNNKHLQAKLSRQIGFDIVYNSDGFILKYVDEKSVLQKENMWAVLYNGKGCLNLFEYNDEFKNVEDAVNHAYKSYEEELDLFYKEEKEFLENIKDIRK